MRRPDVEITVRAVQDAEKRTIKLHVSPGMMLSELRQRVAKQMETAAENVKFSLSGRSLTSLNVSVEQAYAGISFAVTLDAQVIAPGGKNSPSSGLLLGKSGALSSATQQQQLDARFSFSSVPGERVLHPDLLCPVCHDTIVNPAEMPCCGKLLCREKCLFRISMSQGGSCPCCRKNWTMTSLREPSRALLNMIADVKVSCDMCRAVIERGIKGEGFLAHLKTCRGALPPEAPLQVQSGSIQQVVREGELGALLDALDEIRDSLKDCMLKIEFPTVVVCGQESTGKSSVLERICMFPFFPRDHGITTRMPINLKLRHASLESLKKRCDDSGKPYNGPDTLFVKFSFKDFASQVYVLSASNPEDGSRVVSQCQSFVLDKHSSNKSFCHEPLVLEAWGNDLPDLDLVDLPGVYSVRVNNESFDIVETTKQITEDYLRRPSTLVVAVVPATIDRVRNDVVLGMVQRNQKEQLTVCALTKADKCNRSEYNPANPFMDLKERARGKADDCPSLGGGFVALRNRDSRDPESLSLRESAERERSWFLKYMPDLVDENCATADCLVKKIGELMTLYTTKTWSVSALHQITQQKLVAMSELSALGKDPAADPDGTFQELLSSAQKYIGKVTLSHNFGEKIKAFLETLLSNVTKEKSDNSGFGYGGGSVVSGEDAHKNAVTAAKFKRVCRDVNALIYGSFSKEIPAFLVKAIFDDQSKTSMGFLDAHMKNLVRFDNFYSAMSKVLVSRLPRSASDAAKIWQAQFPLLVVSVTISNSTNLVDAVTRLACAIALQEFDMSAPTREELLQIMPFQDLLHETCAEKRASLERALKALDRAERQVQKLQKRK